MATSTRNGDMLTNRQEKERKKNNVMKTDRGELSMSASGYLQL